MIKPPFHFDGHGINDTEGTRVCKVSCCEPYEGSVRNREFDKLSTLLAAAPELLDALIKLCDSAEWIGGVTYEIKDAELQQARATIEKATS